MLVWSRTPTNSMSSWARTWLTASLYTIVTLMCVSSKASSKILPDIIVVSGVNHATSYLFYIWWSGQSRWFKVCRLAKESVEPTAYCLLPKTETVRDLLVGLTECLPLLPSLRSAFCEYITNFLRLTGQNISCIEHQKSRPLLAGYWVPAQHWSSLVALISLDFSFF